MLVYILFVFSEAVNAPVGDDYVMVFSFLKGFQAGGSSEKLALLFSTHNEHRVVLARLVILGIYYFFQEIDFRYLTFFGNLALLFIPLAFWFLIRAPRQTKLLFLPVVSLGVFQPQARTCIFLGGTTIAQFYAALFCVLYFCLIFRNRTLCFLSALLTYSVACVTLANGLFLPLIGIPGLLYQKRFKSALIHAALSMAITFCYFTHYNTTTPFAPSIGQQLLLTLWFFLHQVGSLFDFSSIGKALTFMMGIILFLCPVALLRAKHYKFNLGIFCAACFFILNSGVLAAGRSYLYRTQVYFLAMDGRYRLYAILLTLLIVAAFVERLECEKSLKVSCLLIALALVFNCASFAANWKVAERQGVETVRAIWKWHDSEGAIPLPGNSRESAALAEWALAKGIYRLPKRLNVTLEELFPNATAL